MDEWSGPLGLDPGARGIHHAPMRLLGIDLGRRRIGLALSDPMGWTAQPMDTLEASGDPGSDAARVASICRNVGVSRVVLGLPLDLDGQVGHKAREVLRFRDELEAEGLEVITWDERLSTKAVERVLLDADMSRRRRRQVVDKLAAAYILQGYLDSLSGGDGDRS